MYKQPVADTNTTRIELFAIKHADGTYVGEYNGQMGGKKVRTDVRREAMVYAAVTPGMNRQLGWARRADPTARIVRFTATVTEIYRGGRLVDVMHGYRRVFGWDAQ